MRDLFQNLQRDLIIFLQIKSFAVFQNDLLCRDCFYACTVKAVQCHRVSLFRPDNRVRLPVHHRSLRHKSGGIGTLEQQHHRLVSAKPVRLGSLFRHRFHTAESKPVIQIQFHLLCDGKTSAMIFS